MRRKEWHNHPSFIQTEKAELRFNKFSTSKANKPHIVLSVQAYISFEFPILWSRNMKWSLPRRVLYVPSHSTYTPMAMFVRPFAYAGRSLSRPFP